MIRRWMLAWLLLSIPGALQSQSKEAPPLVIQLEAKGPITPPLSKYLQDGIRHAESVRAEAVLIQMDTPGGLLDSTREIIQAMLNSPLPVVVYVAPHGARATSAGAFIMMASDVAAMAPDTHIGAAHPVSLGGEPGRAADKKDAKGGKGGGSVMEDKAVSDSAAYIRSLAKEKGRNAEWAEQAVRESVSLTALEAMEKKVIDCLAADRASLFQLLNGRQLSKNGKEIRLRLESAAVQERTMSAAQRFLQVLANPNLAYLFLIIGIYGLIYEFSSPGVGFGAIVGIVSLALAAYSMSILPVNYAGLLLIGLGIILLVLELQIVSHGLLTVGGVVLLALGSAFLFDSSEPFVRVSLPLIVGTVAATVFFFGFIVSKILATRRLKPATGAEAMIGEIGEVQQEINPRGMVFVEGELWTAEAESPIPKGARVKILAVQGHVLKVETASERLI